MSFTADDLYALLPAVHRLRDAERGEPLRALLAVIAEQVAAAEGNIESLLDDQFVETCADWVVPYLGDLVGYRPLHAAGVKGLSGRAEVAHTIGYRRRKGTAAMLEQLARDVTGWRARAVEFFQLLGWTQHMNHVRPGLAYAPDLRRWEPLERLGTPFESAARTTDVRHVSRRQGRYNIPNVGLFLWRLGDYFVADSRAFRVDARRWTVHPLGLDAPLFTRTPPADSTRLAEPTEVPLPISRRVLDAHLADYYGDGRSLLVKLDGVAVSADDVCSCDLSDAGGTWAHLPAAGGKIAVDPVLGRIALPPGRTPTRVAVSSAYGFAADTGGGPYDRLDTFAKLTPVVGVTEGESLATALAATAGVVELRDSGRYDDPLGVTVAAGRRLEVRAENLRRPTLRRGGETLTPGEWLIRGGAESELILNGLLIHGHTLRVPADTDLHTLTLRHCTLVPGPDPVLVVEAAGVRVVIEHCIVGPVRAADTVTVTIADSIVDAKLTDGLAFAGPTGDFGGPLRVERTTVVGRVKTRRLDLASNGVFLSPVQVDDRQAGCVRFSYLPLMSDTPRRFRCQPADATTAARVRPQFTSLKYGDPGYGQLARTCPKEIHAGADDEAEMGAFHDLYQPQREANLRTRLDEYLRVRLEAGIFYAT